MDYPPLPGSDTTPSCFPAGDDDTLEDELPALGVGVLRSAAVLCLTAQEAERRGDA
jgi:hypothetical protein